MINTDNKQKKITHAIARHEVMEILDDLNIEKGMLVFVDSDISNMPETIGGKATWVECLKEKVGYEGTIVMPTFSTQLLDPSALRQYERHLYDKVREESLPFHPKYTDVSEENSLATHFLKEEAIYRSGHPIYSFAAWGKYAKVLCEKHVLHFALSKNSPLGMLYEMGGYVLLLGKTYAQSSVFHLSRYLNSDAAIRVMKAPVAAKKGVKWIPMLELEMKNDEYQIIGELLEKRDFVRLNYMQKGEARLFSVRSVVQAASEYMALDE